MFNAEDDGTGGRWGALATQGEKISFCLRDDHSLTGGDDGSGQSGFFTDCGGSFQGISPGWVDIYGASLAGQHFTTTGLPNGIYYIYTLTNPTKSILETNYDNNGAWVSVKISGIPGQRHAETIRFSKCDGDRGLCGTNAPTLSRQENETDELED